MDCSTGNRNSAESEQGIIYFNFHSLHYINSNCPKVKEEDVKVLNLLYLPGPLNIAFIVPDVNACSLFTMNSCPSEDINFTYIASGPSHPPYVFSSPSKMENRLTVSEHND